MLFKKKLENEVTFRKYTEMHYKVKYYLDQHYEHHQVKQAKVNFAILLAVRCLFQVFADSNIPTEI